MAQLGPTTIFGDLKVNGKIIGQDSGAGGIIIPASEFGGTTVHSGAGTGVCKKVIVGMTGIDVATIDIDELIYGVYSIMLRIQMDSAVSTSNIIRIQTYHLVGTTETLLNTAYIKPSEAIAGVWKVYGFVTEFKGNQSTSSPKLRIKISTLVNNPSQYIYFDYVMIAPAYSAIYSLSTT